MQTERDQSDEKSVKQTEVGANSLEVSAPIYIVQLSRGPLPTLLPSLYPKLSCNLSTVLSIQKA